MGIFQIGLAADSIGAGYVNGFEIGAGGDGSWIELFAERLASSGIYGDLVSAGFRGLTTAQPEWTTTGSWTQTVSTKAFNKALDGLAFYGANGTAAQKRWTRPSAWRAVIGWEVHYIDYDDNAGGGTVAGSWSYSLDLGSTWTAMPDTVRHDNGYKKFYVTNSTGGNAIWNRQADASGSSVGCCLAGVHPFYVAPQGLTSGLIVHDLACSGSFQSGFAQSPRLAFLDSVVTGAGSPITNQLDVFLCGPFSNDANFFPNPTTYASNLALEYARQLGTGGRFGFINVYERTDFNTTDQANNRAAAHAQQLTELANRGFTFPLLDWYDEWNKNGWNSPSVGAATQAAGLHDGTHPLQYGHQDLATRVYAWYLKNFAPITGRASVFEVGASEVGTNVIGGRLSFARTLTGVASTATVGTVTVTGATGVALTGVPSSALVGVVTLTPGPVSQHMVTIASGATVGVPSIRSGGPVGVASTATVGVPTMQPGPTSTTLIGVSSTSSVGVPTMGAGFVGLAPASIGRNTTFGHVTTSLASLSGQTVSPLGVGPGTIFGLPVGGYGTGAPQSVGIVAIDPTTRFGVVAGALAGTTIINIVPARRRALAMEETKLPIAGVPSSVVFGRPVGSLAATAPQSFTVTGVSSTATVGVPSVVPHTTLTLAGVASTATVGVPGVLPGGVSTQIAGVPSTAAVGVPTIINQSGAQSFGISGVPSGATVGTPTFTIGSPQATSLLGIASAVSIGVPTLVPGAVTVLVAGAASTSSIGVPILQVGAGQTFGLTGVPSAATVGIPTFTTGSSQSTSITGVASTATVGTATVTPGNLSVAIAAVQSSASVGVPVMFISFGASSFGVPTVASTATVGTPTFLTLVATQLAGVDSQASTGIPTLVPGPIVFTVPACDSTATTGTVVMYQRGKSELHNVRVGPPRPKWRVGRPY